MTWNYWRRASVVAVFALTLFMVWRGATVSSQTPTRPWISPDDRKTFASHVVKGNTVIFVPVNTGMLHFANNLICSLRNTSFNASDLVFWALDEGAEEALKLQGYATYRDPSLYAVSGDENRKGNSPAYKRMMKERPKFYIDILSSGYNILTLDADSVFWQSPLSLIPDIDDPVDAIFSTDAREWYQSKNAFQDSWRRGTIMPPVCNGIFWMRSNRATISLWSDMKDVFDYPPPIGWYKRIGFGNDQKGMDVLLNDGRARLVEPLPEGITPNMDGQTQPSNPVLSVRLLDQTLVTNGQLIHNRPALYEESLSRLRSNGQDRIAAHYNWDTEVLGKVEGARQHGIYFLDQRGNCVID